MITGWTIENFKSIRDKTVFNLASLNIIAGANSSGKSTLIQSILLISQTLQAGISRKDTLISNGSLVKLGDTKDILHFDKQSSQDKLLLNATIADLNNLQINFEIIFMVATGINNIDKLRLSHANYSSPVKPYTKLNYTYIEDKSNISIRPKPTYEPHDIEFRQILPVSMTSNISSGEVFETDITKLLANMDIESPRNERLEEVTRHFLTVLCKLDDTRSRFSSTFLNLIDSLGQSKTTSSFHKYASELRNLDRGAYTTLIDLLQKYRPEYKETVTHEISEKKFPLPEDVNDMVNFLRDYFSNSVHYLGPLRDDPHVIYGIPDNLETRDVGLRGEYTAAMLNQYRDVEIAVPVISESNDLIGSQQMTLQQGVIYWLQQMGLVDRVDVQEMTNIGYQMTVAQSDGKPLALTRVGVGVSQVLPTIVMCLLAEAPCTLLIEQPELHLHPKVQSVLGDFFLLISYLDKQIIVETHSEHIINRLFLRIAQYPPEVLKGDSLREKIKIVFAEKKGNFSTFRTVEPNEYGTIPDDEWPIGFLDQATIDIQAKIKAAADKRKIKPKGSK
jgi:predicted ATPase